MENSVCFIGHKKIKNSKQLTENLRCILTELINNGYVNFIFGDHSEFDDLCYETITELKNKYPKIKRIHFRKDYENTDEYTMQFLIVGYEESICPKGVGSAGRASYVERNRAMINESDVCIFYYDENYRPHGKKTGQYDINSNPPKSGTAIAFRYAVKKEKTIINCCDFVKQLP